MGCSSPACRIQSQALMGTVAARSICVEQLPCPGQCCGGKAGAGIGHAQNKAVVFLCNGQGDGSAARSVGGGVVQKVFRSTQQVVFCSTDRPLPFLL